MKRFWKDYVDLCKHEGDFYKKHWFGLLVFTTVGLAAIYAYFTKDYIKDQILSNVNKEEEEP